MGVLKSTKVKLQLIIMRVCPHLQHHYGQTIQQAGGNVEVGVGGMADIPKSISGKMQALSREARSNQRRLLTAFGIDTDSDLLKFNQLKVRLYHFHLIHLELVISFGCIGYVCMTFITIYLHHETHNLRVLGDKPMMVSGSTARHLLGISRGKGILHGHVHRYGILFLRTCVSETV
jgi:hypothetical protein